MLLKLTLLIQDFDPGIWFYIIIGIPLAGIVFSGLYAFYHDKKNKPQRIRKTMSYLTSVILISRFINDKSDITKDSKKLCKEMICDLFYVLSLYYKEEWGFVNENIFSIESNERKEKLKNEFSEVYQKVVNDTITERFEKKYNIPTIKQANLNLLETNQLIQSYKNEKDWNSDFFLFWDTIFVMVGENL